MEQSRPVLAVLFYAYVVDFVIHSRNRYTLRLVSHSIATMEGEKETKRRGVSRSRHCWIVVNTEMESEAITTKESLHLFDSHTSASPQS